MNNLKKPFALILLGTFAATNVFLFFALPRAEAQQPVDALGKCGGATIAGLGHDLLKNIGIGIAKKEVPTNDKKFQLQDCIAAVSEALFKVALAKFKKQLMDRITDDIIGWIRDGTDPKFISNFGDYVKGAADEALGETLKEVGFAELCTTIPKPRLTFILQESPPFYKKTSCTLNQIVGNIQAFAEDFSAGGFLGYQETLKPQNNKWGMELAIQDELISKTALKQNAANLTAQAGGGFLPQQQCLEWTLLNRTTQEVVPQGGSPILVENNPLHSGHTYFSLRSPNTPFDLRSSNLAENGGVHVNNLPEDVSKFEWKCTKTDVTTPSSLIQTAAGNAQTSDYHYLANADDLTPYLTAIFDAAVNRLIKEGVKGLKGGNNNIFSQSGTGRAPEAYDPTNPRDARYLDYGRGFTSTIDMLTPIRNSITTILTNTTVTLNEARITVTTARAKNTELIATTTDLISCQTNRLGAACSSALSTLERAEERANTILTQQDQIDLIENQLTLIRQAIPNANQGDLITLLDESNNLLAAALQLRASLDQLLLIINTELLATSNELAICRASSPTYSCNGNQ